MHWHGPSMASCLLYLQPSCSWRLIFEQAASKPLLWAAPAAPVYSCRRFWAHALSAGNSGYGHEASGVSQKGSAEATPIDSDQSSGNSARSIDSWLKHRLPFRARGSSSSGLGSAERALSPEQTRRMLRRVEKLMHDAVHLKQTDMPEPTLADLREEYLQLDPAARGQALLLLAVQFNVETERVTDLMRRYLAVAQPPSAGVTARSPEEAGSPGTVEPGEAADATLATKLRLEGDLRGALTPLSVRLFEAINGQRGGLKFLVDLRSDLRRAIEGTHHPALRALDRTLKGMFATWLSPACLELRQITWEDSAALLEKVVAYEAVHPIGSLFDLKRRLGASRRCFAYFHPAIPGEPLVFIEVALTSGISSSIQDVLQDVRPIREEDASTAVFYSISSTQEGLGGIDLGNFLIKRVVRLLQQEMPHIETFVTLSPIPGFLKWLLPKLAFQAQGGGGRGAATAVAAAAAEGATAGKEEDGGLLLLPEEEMAILAGLSASSAAAADPHLVLRDALAAGLEWTWGEDTRALLRAPLMRLCARYLLCEKQRGRALDPVANFHLQNGARLERLNWMADTSARGVALSAGIMVNYRYRLDEIEQNHEAYVTRGHMEGSTSLMFKHKQKLS